MSTHKDSVVTAEVHEELAAFTALHSLDALFVSPRGGPLSGSSTIPRDEVERALDPSSEGPRRYVSAPVRGPGGLRGHMIVGPVAEDGSPDRVCTLARHLAGSVKRLAFLDDKQAHAVEELQHSADAWEVELKRRDTLVDVANAKVLEVEKMKRSFVATVSHELRTPLTSVIGYSEMLLEGLAGELNEEQLDYMQTISDKADQLLQLITGILDVSMIQSNSLRLNRSEIAIREVIEASVTAQKKAMPRSKSTIEVRGTEVPLVHGDRRRIRQVLDHLISNALKFSPSGGDITIQCAVTPLRRGGSNTAAATLTEPSVLARFFGVQISVKDRGIGVPKEKHDDIWEPFFQVDSSSTREYGGTGLGLALAKAYAEAHGGEIWIDSELGEGSTFTITLPAVPSDLASYAARNPLY